MARAVRVEFEGAFYHVMVRGDRREAIVRDDADRATIVRALGEASERSGFRVHAFVLMSNHYHFLLETPQASLFRGMGWLHNAFTRRINTRHRPLGTSFWKPLQRDPGGTGKLLSGAADAIAACSPGGTGVSVHAVLCPPYRGRSGPGSPPGAATASLSR
jgi:REP element-mobilizing transposase RayT